MKNTGYRKMKKIHVKPYLLVALGILCLFLITCEEDPVSIYDPDETGKPQPVLTMVAPDSNFNADGLSFSGVGVVTITGQNFSEVPEMNIAFFDGIPGEVLSASETSLRVRLPDVQGDSVDVKVSVQGAFHFGEYDDYLKVVPAVEEIGGFDDLDQLYSIACDTSETLWIAAFGVPTIQVLAVPPGGLKESKFSALTVSSTALKWGGQDRVYLSGGALVYPIDSKTGTYSFTDFMIFNTADVAKDIDFVDSTLAFVGIKKAPGLGYVMNVDMQTGVIDTAAAYDSLEIDCIRVFDGDLYVSGYYRVDGESQASGIWKSRIIGDSLGTRELVLDLNDYADYANAKITALTFSADGKMYLGLDAVHAILQYDHTLGLQPLYSPVLDPPTRDLTWGNGNHLYQLKTSRLIKIDMVEPGASYGGRY